MVRSPADDHRLELDDGRTIGYTTWGDPEETPVFFVRIADHLDLGRFAALGASGGGPYAIVLGALVPERVRGVAIVSGLGMLDRPDALDGMSEGNVAEFKMAMDSPDDLATAHGEGARTIREDPEGSFAELSDELPEVDRQTLERPDVRAFLIETFQEAVRQGATGWVDDDLRQVRPWPFRLDEIGGVDVRIYHGEADTLVLLSIRVQRRPPPTFLP